MNDQYRVRSLLSWQPPVPPTVLLLYYHYHPPSSHVGPSFFISPFSARLYFLLLFCRFPFDSSLALDGKPTLAQQHSLFISSSSFSISHVSSIPFRASVHLELLLLFFFFSS